MNCNFRQSIKCLFALNLKIHAMKKLLVLFSILSFAIGCDKDVTLVNPIITISPFDPAPLDTVVTKLIGEATIDGENVNIDSYDWQILDEANQEVEVISANNDEMRWSPKDEGVFTILSTVKAGNKTFTETKQVNVKHNTTSIQRYLAGDWIGTGTAPFISNDWQSEFSIESNGHYSARIINSVGDKIRSVFDNGMDSMDDPEKRFTISNIDGNGFATGTVKFVHSPGTILEYGFRDLKFSSDYEIVTFTVFWGAEMTYVLERQ